MLFIGRSPLFHYGEALVLHGAVRLADARDVNARLDHAPGLVPGVPDDGSGGPRPAEDLLAAGVEDRDLVGRRSEHGRVVDAVGDARAEELLRRLRGPRTRGR